MAPQLLPDRQRLTWAQICERYPMQWVVLVDMRFADADYTIDSAIVLGHGGDKESNAMAAPYLGSYRESAHLHTRPSDPPVHLEGTPVPCAPPA